VRLVTTMADDGALTTVREPVPVAAIVATPTKEEMS
jgi:hypothetical protein